jgi:hypothetical protein
MSRLSSVAPTEEQTAAAALTQLRGGTAAALVAGKGVTTLSAGEVVVDADVPQIPVGIDGEMVMMLTAVRCTIQPQVLRVGVPRNRPGTRPAKPALHWPALRQLASFRSAAARI